MVAPPGASNWSAPSCNNGICPVSLIWENSPLPRKLSRDILVFSGSPAAMLLFSVGTVVEKLLELKGRKAPGLRGCDAKSESMRSPE